jgi:hypothetical protein
MIIVKCERRCPRRDQTRHHRFISQYLITNFKGSLGESIATLNELLPDYSTNN